MGMGSKPLSKNAGPLAQPFGLRVLVLWAFPRPRKVDFVPTPLACTVRRGEHCTSNVRTRGTATGVYRVYIPPKSVKVNILWGINDVRTAIEHKYP